MFLLTVAVTYPDSSGPIHVMTTNNIESAVGQSGVVPWEASRWFDHKLPRTAPNSTFSSYLKGLHVRLLQRLLIKALSSLQCGTTTDSMLAIYPVR